MTKGRAARNIILPSLPYYFGIYYKEFYIIYVPIARKMVFVSRCSRDMPESQRNALRENTGIIDSSVHIWQTKVSAGSISPGHGDLPMSFHVSSPDDISPNSCA